MHAEAVCAVRGLGRMAAWRAHAYAAPQELRLDAARVPPLRAPSDVRVRVHQTSLNPLDVAMTGGYGSRVLNTLRALEGGEGVEFPLVPGRDFVGEVAEAGPGARLRPGSRVWGVVPPHRPGAHADYVVLDQRWVGPAPAALGAAAGGALFAALSASAALRAAGVWGAAGRGARVLLLGLGGVGHAALQLLTYHGAQVVVGSAGEQSETARALGAVAALDRHAADYPQALELAGPYDAIIDCAGLGGDEAGARRWRFKRFVTLTTPLLRETDARGLVAGGVVAAAQLAAQCLSAASGAWSGAGSGAWSGAGSAPACPPHVRWAYFVPRADDIELLRRLAERGEFTVAVERVFPWRAARAAYERAARGRARGKLLLDFTDDGPGGA
ncbi:reticulon-4-interacting protein 1, mitochondrial isoform X1 [Plodia interpunctella]|uniref:reticulon-4-interacting protein 1, mitochondrial isoform X1 n=1 Tax=Plodia interpunctella TaxID=58824 RepID=UPI0023689B90|nr:reticulon-4-interacting protein 1, mitochondrial isoform X1 [Plodia interpunctella]XP_053606940.1 reticulon-4-interacting protein 1, mitochondrial isoform X1 [Plodia interpunctella]XP_053606941.1 reticulon-4-interacting protein 1, mitochondrial isoform X1 [Plodia interpunctella]XP_053606942.1 reticulon-4-interacting protein 1, mitochondrial isoform X1 [Plodia interpunctella]